jgi:CRP-like cAMP-binding protein
MKENLIQTLGFGGLLNQDEIRQIAEEFEFRPVKAGDHFIVQDSRSSELAFIDHGIMRAYISSDNLQEATKHFLRRNQFAMDIPSFYDDLPATVSIQAVTETHLLVINRTTWQQLCAAVPKLFLFTKTFSELTFLNKIKDTDYLRFGTAKEKYLEFVRRYPDLALSVPLQYIASYLQITPQSLSRIRKQSAR